MKSYGFIIEFKPINREGNHWKNHWNHKVYTTNKAADEAIEQMKKAYDFYKNDYEWRIIELYCNTAKPI